MRYSYVMTLQDSAGMMRRRDLVAEEVSGSVEELTGGLRPWAMAYLNAESRDNGWYAACLVEPDDDGDFDTYYALAWEDVLWYWDGECAPIGDGADRKAMSHCAPS